MSSRVPRRARAAAGTGTPAAASPRDQVRVRMYGQGVGDCFLITFPRAPETGAGAAAARRPVHVLIDCGVVAGTPDGAERMRAVVRDIRQATADPALPGADGQPQGHLDLLIVTHEHWDHLSGFVQARAEWDQIQVDALWTAWTEKDEPEGLPGVLKRILERQGRAMARIADHSLQFGLGDRQGPAVGLMSFLSDAADAGLAFSAAPTVGDAFTVAKGLVASGRHVCCEPGDARRIPGTDAIARVLGPPRDDARLRQLNPTRRGRETFEHAPAGSATDGAAGRHAAPDRPLVDPTSSLRGMAEGRSAFNAFTMALLDSAMGAAGPLTGEESPAAGDMDQLAEVDIANRSIPFEPTARVPIPTAEATVAREAEAMAARARAARESAAPAAQGRDEPAEEASDYPALASYLDPVNHWRRIDFDWLAAAESFALQADSLTNNTSLVLAIELPLAAGREARDVLLFVGDAQVGNWLSWDELPAWRPHDGLTATGADPTVEDLLRRTVFYKVGHHGSHNATLKRAVERMRPGGSLTAFVPVSLPVAREIKGWSQMPLDTLLAALAQRAGGGRVVLPNGNLWPPLPAERLAAERERLGLRVAPATLPPKRRAGETAVLEEAVPLWVEVAFDG